MTLVKLGRRTVNLEYMIYAESCDPGPAAPVHGEPYVDLVVEPGVSLPLGPRESDALCDALGELAPDRAGSPPPKARGLVGKLVTPRGGGKLGRKKAE